jgi:hypothetical protein
LSYNGEKKRLRNLEEKEISKILEKEIYLVELCVVETHSDNQDVVLESNHEFHQEKVQQEQDIR